MRSKFPMLGAPLHAAVPARARIWRVSGQTAPGRTGTFGKLRNGYGLECRKVHPKAVLPRQSIRARGSLANPDLVLQAKHPFLLPASGPDIFWKFVLDPGLTARATYGLSKFVRGRTGSRAAALRWSSRNNRSRWVTALLSRRPK
jgi:hypothetical protein